MSQPPYDAGTERWIHDRRRVLAGLLVALAAGASAACGADAGAPRTGRVLRQQARSRSDTPALDTDIVLVRKAIADEERLLALGTAVARRYPATRARLAASLQGQTTHVRRLRASLTDLDPPAAGLQTPLARTPQAAVAQMARQVALVSDARLAGCRLATAGLLAELLGSVAAAHAVTAVSLGGSISPTGPVATGPVGDVAPLQLCLSAEHAAVYGYGLLGGVLSAGVSDSPLAGNALASYATHRARRDSLEQVIGDAGPVPVAAAAAYDVPFPVTGPASASRLAQLVEERSAAVYAQATAAMASGERDFVSAALVDCAVRDFGWGAQPVTFPGLLAP